MYLLDNFDRKKEILRLTLHVYLHFKVRWVGVASFGGTFVPASRKQLHVRLPWGSEVKTGGEYETSGVYAIFRTRCCDSLCFAIDHDWHGASEKGEPRMERCTDAEA